MTAHPVADRSDIVPSRMSVLLVSGKTTSMSMGIRGYSRHSIMRSSNRFKVPRRAGTSQRRIVSKPQSYGKVKPRNRMTESQGEDYEAGDFSKTFMAMAFCFIFLTSPTYETARIILVNCER
jgi:hypothetical protein